MKPLLLWAAWPLWLVLILLLPRTWAQDCQSQFLHLVVLNAPIGAEPPWTTELFKNVADKMVVEVPAGQVGSTTLYAGIVSQLSPSAAVGSWQIQMTASSGIKVTSISLPPGLPVWFTRSGIPSLLGTSGFYSSTFLLPGKTLPSRGTASVLRFTVTASAPQGDSPISGFLRWSDGCTGCSSSFLNGALVWDSSASIGGYYSFFCERQGVQVTFVKKPDLDARPGNFIRCDPDNDGKPSVGELIELLNQIFINGLALSCRDAGDCNGDREVDLSDPLYGFSYLLFNTAPPPPPFPGCGRIEGVTTAASCPAGSTSCP
ncbi:MAG: hypothetical protein HY717_06990 [Planctomycetes bacterium]|nr:hypothetical protein [Planctomycetota bacterium]